MSKISAKETAVAVVGITTGLYSAYRGIGALYEQHRIENLPYGGGSQSILPFYDTMVEASDDAGLVIASAGGIVKQALKDPYTLFDLVNRRYYVSDDPGSKTLKKATLYRPKPEINLRDLDVRVKYVHEEGVTQPASAKTSGKVAKLSKSIQEKLDATASEFGFPRGPVLSLFTYESPFDHHFMPTDYATRTAYNEQVDEETLFDNNGNSLTLPVDEPWDCVVPYQGGELIIPTDSPQTILGRTLTRPIVARLRDLHDVESAIHNIQAKGLDIELLSDWNKYQGFRNELDQSISLQKAIERARAKRLGAALSTLIAMPAMKLAGRVEESYIGMAIRDPESPIFSFMERQMGVIK